MKKFKLILKKFLSDYINSLKFQLTGNIKYLEINSNHLIFNEID